jgi:hypothetical protein
MKIKLQWLILLLALLSVAAVIVPRLKYWVPSLGPSIVQAARPEQATPEAVVTSVFETADQGGDSDNANEVMTDRLNTMHLIEGKGSMTPEEQKFDGLFWDNKRSAAIYGYLRAGLTRAANITANNTNGDAAVIRVAVKIFPREGSEWVDSTYTVELKKRGPNWYVDEMKTPHQPGGAYQAFKQKMGIP